MSKIIDFIFRGKDEVSGTSKKVSGSLRKTEKTAKKTSKSFGGLSKAAKGLAGAFAGVAAGRAILDFMGESIKLAEKQIQAEAKLEGVLKATGNAAGLSADQLKTMASSLQNVTTVGDETILGVQSMLLTFKNIGGDIFPRVTEATLDMAKAMNTDLDSAAKQSGKALNDPVKGLTALSRAGVQFTDDQKAMTEKFVEMGEIGKAQNIILEEMEGQFGGVSRAMAETDAGKIKQLENSIGDLQEKLGEGLIPIVLKAKEKFLKLAEGALHYFGILDGDSATKKKAAEFQRINSVLLDLGKTYEELEQEYNTSVFLTNKQEMAFLERMENVKKEYDAAREKRDELMSGPKIQEPSSSGPTGSQSVDNSAKTKALKTEMAVLRERKELLLEIADANRTSQEKEINDVKTAIEEKKAVFEEGSKWRIALAEIEAKKIADINKKYKEKELAEQLEYRQQMADAAAEELADRAEVQQKIADALTEAREWNKEQRAIQAEKEEEDRQSKLDGLNEIANTSLQINQLIEQATSARIMREKEDLKSATSARRDAIKSSLMSEKRKEKELAKLDKEAAKKRHEIAMGEWRMNLVMAIANTALGVTRALSSMGPPANFVMAALTGAAGAISIATIAANKPEAPKFQEGGFVDGASTGDKNRIAVNGGEMVSTTSMQRRLLDYAEGRVRGRQSNNNINMQGNTYVINNATQDTAKEVEMAEEESRQRLLDSLYEANERGEIDNSRLQGVFA